MKANRREIGLLYRIRDLFFVARVAFENLSRLEREGAQSGWSVEDRLMLQTAIKTMAKCLAIEEGKQNSDYENYGLLLSNLNPDESKREKKWRKKTSQ